MFYFVFVLYWCAVCEDSAPFLFEGMAELADAVKLGIPGSSPGSFTKLILCLTNDADEKDVVGFKPLYLFDF